MKRHKIKIKIFGNSMPYTGFNRTYAYLNQEDKNGNRIDGLDHYFGIKGLFGIMYSQIWNVKYFN